MPNVTTVTHDPCCLCVWLFTLYHPEYIAIAAVTDCDVPTSAHTSPAEWEQVWRGWDNSYPHITQPHSGSLVSSSHAPPMPSTTKSTDYHDRWIEEKAAVNCSTRLSTYYLPTHYHYQIAACCRAGDPAPDRWTATRTAAVYCNHYSSYPCVTRTMTYC